MLRCRARSVHRVTWFRIERVMRTEASEVTADHLDIVHTVTERYDGPVRGIAEFRGRPHYYELSSMLRPTSGLRSIG